MSPVVKTLLTILLSYGAGLLSYMAFSGAEPQMTSNQPLSTEAVEVDLQVPDGSFGQLPQQQELAQTLEVTVKKLEQIKLEKEALEAELDQIRPQQEELVERERERGQRQAERFNSRMEQRATQTSSQLSLYLELDPQQAQLLDDLMQQKVQMMAEARAKWLEGRELGLSREELQEQWQEYVEESKRFQEEFEQQMESALTYEQLEKYQTYEQERAEYSYKRQLLSQQSKINFSVPDLTQGQKSQLDQLFSTAQPDVSQVHIGTYGTPQGYRGSVRLSQEQVIAMVSGILTPEQVEAYKKAKDEGKRRGRR